MKINLVSMGSSKGLELPQSIVKQCDFRDQVDLRVEDRTVIITPVSSLREGWDAAFEKAGPSQDDKLLVPDILENDWDDEEWEW